MLKKLCSASALTLFCAVMSPANAIEPEAPAKLIDAAQSIGLSLRHQIERKTKFGSKRNKEEYAAISNYYGNRDNAPYWTTENGLSQAAIDMIAEIQQADNYGLEPEKFNLNWTPAPKTAMTHDERINAEKKLSLAMLQYARFAKGGRFDPTKLSRMIDRGSVFPAASKLLADFESADSKADYLRSLHPQHPQFERLRQKWLSLHAKSATHKRIHLPAGPVLKPGRIHRNVVLLRKRLGILLPLSLDGTEGFNPKVYDSQLEEAVKAFQIKHNLKPDGIVGSSTRRTMNINNESQAQILLVNMERWRWMPENLGKTHIQINIPAFRFKVVKNGKSIHSEKVVVGKLANKTPIFSDEMESIVFHPFWNVPASIINKEIYPSLRRSTSVLKRHNLKVKYRGRPIDPYYVNWNNADLRQYHFYQPPSRSNVLGQMKFMFPNDHAVYMHDTSSKQYFAQKVRTYSHGCIRVQNPKKLAELLLHNDKGWSNSRVDRILANGSNSSVKLNTKVPVHITYLTAVIDDNGKLKTYGDYYGHDRRISAALNGKAHLIALEAQREAKSTRIARRIKPKPTNLFEAIFGNSF